MARIEASVRAKQLVAAARTVLSREGVAKTPLRAVAAEGQVPLGTLQYVFPTREELLAKVIEDVVNEISAVFGDAAHTGDGLADTLRRGIRAFWTTLAADRNLQIMQYELTTYSLREPGHEHLARWQYKSYAEVVARWCRSAADSAGETCALDFDQLARVIVASIDGLILQFICNPDTVRADADLDVIIEMIVGLAAPRPKD